MKIMKAREESLELGEFGLKKNFRLSFDLFRETDDKICFHFKLNGDLKNLLVEPFNREFKKKDELWKTTCFELFLGEKEGSSYTEWNFSPSSAYQTYYFETYRIRRANISSDDEQRLLKLERKDESDHISFFGVIELSQKLRTKPLTYWPTAVLQDRNLVCQYFAYKHPEHAPDFHLSFKHEV